MSQNVTHSSFPMVATLTGLLWNAGGILFAIFRILWRGRHSIRYLSHSMARVGRAKKKEGTVAVRKSVGRFLDRRALKKAFLEY